MRARTGLKAAVGASLVVALTALGSPASAGDDDEAEAGGLEVQVRPAIATPSGVVTVAAEFELDDEDVVEQEDPDEEESPSAPTDVPVQPATTATDPAVQTPDGEPADGQTRARGRRQLVSSSPWTSVMGRPCSRCGSPSGAATR